MLCARQGQDRTLALLLSLSPSVADLLAAVNEKGDTALHFASAWGHLKCIRALLLAGADPSARNYGNWTPVAYSSTVAAEVYFRNLIVDVERRREEAIERERELRQRREGGVRMVTDDSSDDDDDDDDDDDGDDDGERMRERERERVQGEELIQEGWKRFESQTRSGRVTPSGGRREWGLGIGLRGRSGSVE
jgi:hypothetical protein